MPQIQSNLIQKNITQSNIFDDKPSFSMPTARHFWNRQAWHALRRRFVISQPPKAGHVYSILPVNINATVQQPMLAKLRTSKSALFKDLKETEKNVKISLKTFHM